MCPPETGLLGRGELGAGRGRLVPGQLPPPRRLGQVPGGSWPQWWARPYHGALRPETWAVTTPAVLPGAGAGGRQREHHGSLAVGLALGPSQHPRGAGAGCAFRSRHAGHAVLARRTAGREEPPRDQADPAEPVSLAAGTPRGAELCTCLPVTHGAGPQSHGGVGAALPARTRAAPWRRSGTVTVSLQGASGTPSGGPTHLCLFPAARPVACSPRGAYQETHDFEGTS